MRPKIENAGKTLRLAGVLGEGEGLELAFDHGQHHIPAKKTFFPPWGHANRLAIFANRRSTWVVGVRVVVFAVEDKALARRLRAFGDLRVRACDVRRGRQQNVALAHVGANGHARLLGVALEVLRRHHCALQSVGGVVFAALPRAQSMLFQDFVSKGVGDVTGVEAKPGLGSLGRLAVGPPTTFLTVDGSDDRRGDARFLCRTFVHLGELTDAIVQQPTF